MPKMFCENPRVWGFLLLSFLLALAAGFWSARRIGDSRIDVGVDLAEAPGVPPTLVVSGPDAKPSRSIAMEPISPDFSPLSAHDFELLATGQRNPKSQSAEVWLRGLPANGQITQIPPGSWKARGLAWTHSGQQPATLKWHGLLENGRIALGMHQWSGIARLKTAQGEELYDLYYNPDDVATTIPLTRQPQLKGAPQDMPEDMPEGSFELTALGRKSRDSQGCEVWLNNFPFPDQLIQDPPNSWKRAGQNLYCSGSTTATLRWRGRPDPAFITLGRHDWSGLARVKTVNGEATVDLFQPKSPSKLITIPPSAHYARYRAQVVRRDIPRLRLRVDGTLAAPQLGRLYVGTLYPTVFLAAAKAPVWLWGKVTTSWAPAWQRAGQSWQFALPLSSPLETGGLGTVLAVALAVFCFLILLGLAVWVSLGLLRWLLRNDSPPRQLEAFSPRLFFVFFIPLVLMGLFYLACFYPGLMSLDTLYQWQQIDMHQINDHHPALHTLTMQLMRIFGNTPAPMAIAQILGLSALIAYAMTLLLRAGVPWRVVFIAWLAILISPHNNSLMISVIKDTPFGFFCFLVTLMLAYHLLNNQSRRGRLFWIALGVSLAMIPLYRHNGLLILVGMIPLLLIFFWRQRRAACLAILAALVTFVGVRQGLYPALNVQGRNFTQGSVWFGWSTGAFVAQEPPFSQAEYDFLNRVRAMDDRWLYSPESGAMMAWGNPKKPYEFAYANEHIRTFAGIHKSLIHRYPLLFLRHLCQINAYLYWIPRPQYAKEIIFFELFLTNNSGEKNAMRDFGYPMKPLLPGIHDTMGQLLMPTLVRPPKDVPFGWLLWRPALRLYLALLAMGIALWRTRDCRLLIVLAPVLINTLSLTYGAPQEVRYQYPMVLAAGFLIALAFLPKKYLPASEALKERSREVRNYAKPVVHSNATNRSGEPHV